MFHKMKDASLVFPPGIHYQLPSGSKFTEDEVSAILTSETGSEVASSAKSASWRRSRMASKLHKSPRKASSPPSCARDRGHKHGYSLMSFTTSVYPAESFTEDDRLNIKSHENPFLIMLSRVAPEESRNCLLLMQTSLSHDRDTIRDIIPQKNGFVNTVMEAFNNHRGLIIRPDNVWLAILLQFNCFVNAGRVDGEEFMMSLGENLYAANPSFMADHILNVMREKIPHWEKQEWITSSFTTSTNIDTTAFAMATIATVEWDWVETSSALRHGNHCGIARVTLEGTKRDWENMLMRLEKLKDYGIPAIAWHHHLRPIISRFIQAYDNPNDPENLDFWNKVIIYDDTTESPLITGWITAFCIFGEHGRWQGNPLNEDRAREHEPRKLLRPANPLHLPPSQFASVYTHRDRNPRLVLDNFPYPMMDLRTIPCGRAHLYLKIVDKGRVLDAELVAGSIGSQICSTEKSDLFRNGMRDTIRPVTAWWLFKRYSYKWRQRKPTIS
ncbi:hypothetical protein J3A83DRAFT_3789871 [Scleroderma citrinum]